MEETIVIIVCSAICTSPWEETTNLVELYTSKNQKTLYKTRIQIPINKEK